MNRILTVTEKVLNKSVTVSENVLNRSVTVCERVSIEVCRSEVLKGSV